MYLAEFFHAPIKLQKIRISFRSFKKKYIEKGTKYNF
jgi:hypothetical protein